MLYLMMAKMVGPTDIAINRPNAIPAKTAEIIFAKVTILLIKWKFPWNNSPSNIVKINILMDSNHRVYISVFESVDSVHMGLILKYQE